MHVAARLAAEADRDHLPGFRVVAKTRRIGHPDEFEFHDGIRHLERRRDDCRQRIGIRAVADDQEFTIERNGMDPAGMRDSSAASRTHSS